MKQKNNHIVLTALCFLLLFTLNGFGQGDEITMKAVFMERFTRYIEWPQTALNNDSTFNILFLGENKFGNKMDQLFSVTPIQNKPVKVFYSKNIREIAGCHIVYILPSMKGRLSDVLKIVSQYPVLSLGDTPGFANRGVMINFVVENDMLRFEINLKEIRESELNAGSALLKIAKIVEK